jgi:hypothetical protein
MSMRRHRCLLLAATTLGSVLIIQGAHADFGSGLLGGVIGGIIAGSQQQQQQQQQNLQQQNLQQQQIQQQQQIEADRQRAAAEARQRAEAARRQQAAVAKAAADKAVAPAVIVPAAAPVAPAVIVPQPAPPTIIQTQVNSTTIVNLTNDAAEARGLIQVFKAIIDEQRKVAEGDKDLSDVAGQSITVLEVRVKELQSKFLDTTTELSRYRTSVKPNDPDLQITARKASELYPKVPFYIPGTPETGEFWIEPLVTDTGELAFNLKFIDPKSENDKTRASILLTASNVETIQKALVQVVKWAKVAHDKHIRRTYTQRAACFPTDRCPAESGTKREGMASTEIDFKVYEDGSTAGRIQRNKGLFEDGYNISIDSASMLQAYFHHILTEGKTDYEAGSRTDDQMKDLFKAGS